MTATLAPPAPVQAEPIRLVKIEMTGKKKCDNCDHGRTQHSFQGCTYREPDGSGACACTVTYMDL